MKKLLNDFKAFAFKGNVLDMAVGVVIGGEFGKIVTSVVNDIIMPPIGLLVGGVDFKELKWVMQEAVPEQVNEAGEVIAPAVAEVSMMYGNFLQQTFDFLIIAFSIFLFVSLIKKMSEKKKVEEPVAPAPPPAPSKEEVLLTEIRDLLKEKK